MKVIYQADRWRFDDFQYSTGWLPLPAWRSLQVIDADTDRPIPNVLVANPYESKLTVLQEGQWLDQDIRHYVLVIDEEGNELTNPTPEAMPLM